MRAWLQDRFVVKESSAPQQARDRPGMMAKRDANDARVLKEEKACWVKQLNVCMYVCM
jgi:hypothetical protein